MFDHKVETDVTEKLKSEGLERAGPSQDDVIGKRNSKMSDQDSMVPSLINRDVKSQSLNHKVKSSQKMLRSLGTFADEWTILTGTTDEEIIEEITLLN